MGSGPRHALGRPVAPTSPPAPSYTSKESSSCEAFPDKVCVGQVTTGRAALPTMPHKRGARQPIHGRHRRHQSRGTISAGTMGKLSPAIRLFAAVLPGRLIVRARRALRARTSKKGTTDRTWSTQPGMRSAVKRHAGRLIVRRVRRWRVVVIGRRFILRGLGLVVADRVVVRITEAGIAPLHL